MQGRFSGRLATKEDEKRLAEECKLLAPLLGGVGKRGDRSRLTLAKIVRGIAKGDIRQYLEAREEAHRVSYKLGAQGTVTCRSPGADSWVQSFNPHPLVRTSLHEPQASRLRATKTLGLLLHRRVHFHSGTC